MKHLEKLTRKRLGEILVDEGLISKSQLADAERAQKQTGEPLGYILVDSKYITDTDLAKVVASQYQLPYVSLSVFPRAKELESLFEPEEMRARKFLPLDRIGRVFTMAVGEMPDIEFLRDVSERLQATPFLFVTQIGELRSVLDGGNGTAPPSETAAPVPESEEDDEVDLAKYAGVAPEIVEGLEVFDRILPDDPEEEQDRKSEEKSEAPPSRASGEDWENIFDSADASIRSDLDRS